MTLKYSKGFTDFELTFLIIIIGILTLVMAVFFLAEYRNHARINAARADTDLFLQGLGMYEIDHSDYPVKLDLKTAGSTLVDPNDNAYVALPDGKNFAAGLWSYKYLPASNHHGSAYEIKVQCLDDARTWLLATPDGITVGKKN
jgi:hypothetical protein